MVVAVIIEWLTEAQSCGQVMRVMAQWDILDEKKARHFSANAATRQLVRGKEATLGSFVDHQVWHSCRAVQHIIILVS